MIRGRSRPRQRVALQNCGHDGAWPSKRLNSGTTGIGTIFVVARFLPMALDQRYGYPIWISCTGRHKACPYPVARGHDGAWPSRMNDGPTSKMEGRAPSRPTTCRLIIHGDSRPRQRVALHNCGHDSAWPAKLGRPSWGRSRQGSPRPAVAKPPRRAMRVGGSLSPVGITTPSTVDPWRRAG